MDRRKLEELGEGGFEAVPGNRMDDLAQWCQDYSEASGDARYASIGRSLQDLSDWWQRHDNYGGIPAALRDEVERELRWRIPEILGSSSAADASILTRGMRERIEGLLLEPEAWIEHGYMRRA